jgi:hypothetical protein
MNPAVTDPGETVIATDAVPQWASARDANGPPADCQQRHGLRTAGRYRHRSQARRHRAFHTR